ncbi:MAG: DUF3781 domain-containing protein [Firmicutes bacterium]|nr:DUF3781 domain-containing protein [Bacillota bacterium]
MKNELLNHINEIHTTDLGIVRIKRNLNLETNDVVSWCREKINSKQAEISRTGKNWYVKVDGCVITVNAYSYTIITAHRIKPIQDA